MYIMQLYTQLWQQDIWAINWQYLCDSMHSQTLLTCKQEQKKQFQSTVPILGNRRTPWWLEAIMICQYLKNHGTKIATVAECAGVVR